MPARPLLATLALPLALGLAAPPAAASPGELTIVTRDESFQRAVQSAYAQPFTAVTGLPVAQETWEGGTDALRTRQKAAEPTWDLVLLDADELATGCAEGILEKLDWSAAGGRDHYAAGAASDCGAGAVIAATVLAWDRDKLAATPTWADFWDVAKYPGKRGLRRGARGNLEIALLADGVAVADVYKALATPEGIDRAFRKLDQLKPYIDWWPGETEAARMLASGNVLMTSAPSGQIARAAEAGKRNFGLQFAGSLYEVQSWAVPKGTPMLRTAQQFLYFTGLPLLQARLLRASGESGLAKGLNELLTPELLATAPSNPANLAVALRSDAAFWRDNQARLRQRFDTWIGH
jgi:putative spermidine/putrescine transport system substrate-binding protein